MTEMTMILDGGGAPKETDCWKATADGCRPLAGDVGACCTSFAHEKSCNATRPHGWQRSQRARQRRRQE